MFHNGRSSATSSRPLSPSRPDGSTTSSCCQPQARSSGQGPHLEAPFGRSGESARAPATLRRLVGPRGVGPTHRPCPPSRWPGGRRTQLQAGRFLAQRRRLRVWPVGCSGQLCGVSRDDREGAASCACPARSGPGGTAGTRAVRVSGQRVRDTLAGLAVRTTLPEPLGPQRPRRRTADMPLADAYQRVRRHVAAPADSAPSRWYHYQTIVTPDPGTRSLKLFLYADVYTSGALTTNEYSDVVVRRSPVALQPVVVATPRRHERPAPALYTRAGVSRRTGSGRPEISVWRSMGCATAGSARTQGTIPCASARHRGICCRALPRFSPPVSSSRSRSPGAEAGTDESRKYEPLRGGGNMDDILADRYGGSTARGPDSVPLSGEDWLCLRSERSSGPAGDEVTSPTTPLGEHGGDSSRQRGARHLQPGIRARRNIAHGVRPDARGLRIDRL